MCRGMLYFTIVIEAQASDEPYFIKKHLFQVDQIRSGTFEIKVK